MNENQLANKLQQLSSVHILYSECTGKFYVPLYGIEIKTDDGMLTSVSHHCDTPLEALQTTFTALIFARIIVKDAYKDSRKEFKWEKDNFILV